MMFHFSSPMSCNTNLNCNYILYLDMYIWTCTSSYWLHNMDKNMHSKNMRLKMTSMLNATFRAPALATTIGISLCIAIDFCSCCWDFRTELVSVLLLLTSSSSGPHTIRSTCILHNKNITCWGSFQTQRPSMLPFDCRCNICSLLWRMLGSSMMLSCGWKKPYSLLQYFTSSCQTEVNQTSCVLSWKQTTHCFANIEFHVSRPSFISWCNKLHI